MSVQINLANFIVFRENAGFSQRGLSLAAGLSPATVNKIELTGKASEKKIAKIAEKLGKNVQDLILKNSSIGTIYESPSPQYGESAQNVLNLIMFKAKRVGLNRRELKQLGEIIGRIGDLLTIENPQERKKYADAVMGIINLCHSVLFPGEWMGGEELFSSREIKKRIE